MELYRHEGHLASPASEFMHAFHGTVLAFAMTFVCWF